MLDMHNEGDVFWGVQRKACVKNCKSAGNHNRKHVSLATTINI